MVDIIDPGGRSVCKKTGIFFSKNALVRGSKLEVFVILSFFCDLVKR